MEFETPQPRLPEGLSMAPSYGGSAFRLSALVLARVPLFG